VLLNTPYAMNHALFTLQNTTLHHTTPHYSSSSGAGNEDILLMKVTSVGAEVWTKTYGGGSDDRAYSVLESSDNGFIVAGRTASFGAGMCVCIAPYVCMHVSMCRGVR
jgi:hypothetical protein